MEHQLWFFRRTDCIRTAKRQHQPHICYIRRRSAQSELFLDTPSVSGNHRTAHHRFGKRQNLDTLRPAHPLPFCRFSDRGARDVPAAQRRQFRHGSGHGDGLRTGVADVPRYFDQHGHAAFQNAGGRHGKRETEGTGLLHPELPMQCRQPGRLSVPVHLHVYRHQQYGGQGDGTRFGDLLVLHRCRHPDPVRHLHHGKSERDAPERV